jgi:hypothetical protein
VGIAETNANAKEVMMEIFIVIVFVYIFVKSRDYGSRKAAQISRNLKWGLGCSIFIQKEEALHCWCLPGRVLRPDSTMEYSCLERYDSRCSRAHN